MFVQQVVNGLMLGGAYALVAIGYTLIFGVLNLLHLAHGEVFMVGAYVGLALALAGFSPWITLAGAMLAAAVLGVVVERVAFRPVRNRGSHVTPLITTIAVGLVLQHVVVKIFGAEPVAFPAPFASASLGLAIMLLGGLGNVTGAMVGGLIVGVVEVMSVAYLASSYRDAFAFAVMILILMVRPTGLFGARLQTG